MARSPRSCLLPCDHLHCFINTKTKRENSMAVKILIKPNGPYVVSGDMSQVEITDINGNKYDITGKPAVALCRCGGSVNKPFCDGTHSKIGFQGAEAAVRAEKKG